MDERIEKLTDDVTAGLGDDPELRLDVRQELRAHLQETAEQLQAAGQILAQDVNGGMIEITFER